MIGARENGTRQSADDGEELLVSRGLRGLEPLRQKDAAGIEG